MTEHHATLLSRNSVFQEATQGAPSELLEILENARNFLTTTVADSTKQVYARDWNSFVRWCDDLGLPHLPSSPDVVACYFTSLAMKDFRVPTIRRHCAAIAAAHREAGYPTPTSHPAIKELLHGMTRKIGCSAKPVDALLSEDIRRVVKAMPDTLINARDKAIILIGFAGAFRRSEIVGLNVDDISHRDEGIVILLRKSKTDQQGEGRWVGLPYGKSPDTCPVNALRHWLEVSEISEGAIFRGLDRHGNFVSKRLSIRSVGNIIKRAVKAAGLDPEKYSGHSLRSGHCTQASRAGVAEHVIAQQTGHKSMSSLKRYIRLGRLFEENSADSLGL
ncbi:MAG: site-specific integrase [Armatimonadota bacterium]|nr:site-specific integrase [Armatimonadota bacterium]